MSAVASRQDLNAYFDRVATPNQLIEKNFGERLHLKSAYEKYQLPEGVDPKGVRVAKDRNDNKWKVSVDLGEKGQTSRHEISFDDGYSLFKTKTATREQIAAKYLNTEITGMLAANTAKVEKSASTPSFGNIPTPRISTGSRTIFVARPTRFAIKGVFESPCAV